MHYRQNLGMAVGQASEILRMIQAVVHQRIWLREAAKWVDIPWGELLSCLPSPNGGENGESRQKPSGLKKGVPPCQHVSLLDFDFQCGHVGGLA